MKNIIISLILSSLLASLAYFKKAMTPTGLALAFLFCLIITYIGGLSCFLVLAFVFLGTLIAGKIKKEQRRKIYSSKIAKSTKKDASEIIANVFLGTLSLIIYKLTSNEIFIIVYASIMAESLADSLASDIGVLSKSKPINIRTLKKSEPGLSGNISLLGLIASLLGAFFIALTLNVFNFNLRSIFIITICGFLGALFDSILGLFQIKYKCPKCGEITEQTIHCQTKTHHHEGISLLNNDSVNFLGNLFAGLVSFLLLLI